MMNLFKILDWTYHTLLLSVVYSMYFLQLISHIPPNRYFGGAAGAAKYDQTWWHHKLADYFFEVNVIHRKVEVSTISFLSFLLTLSGITS